MAKFIIMVAAIVVMAAGAAEGKSVAGSEVCNSFTASYYSDKVLNCVGGADGHHVYETKQKCPIGGEEFKALTLGTHSTFGRHLDWEPVSYMRFPIPLPVCPGNGFVITKSEYSEDELKKLKEVVESTSFRSLYAQKHASFFLFAKMLEASKEKRDDQWWLYLNATWEADNCKNEDRYKEYALEVVASGNKRIAELKESDQLFWVLKIIVANMHRRIGDFKTAQRLADEIGKVSLEDTDANQFFELGKKLLKKAISEKNTNRVPIREEKEDDGNS